MTVDRKVLPASDDKRTSSEDGTSTLAPPPAYAESAATATTSSSVPPPSSVGLPSSSTSNAHNVDLEAQHPHVAQAKPNPSTPLIPTHQAQAQPQSQLPNQPPSHQVLILRPAYPHATRRATRRFFATLLWALVVYLAACLVTGIILAIIDGQIDIGGRRGRGPGKDWDWDGDWITLAALRAFVRR